MTESFPQSEIGFPTSLIFFGVTGILLCVCYRWALPRPIPGIPYNKEAAKNLLGDLIPMLRYTFTTKEDLSKWLVLQNKQLQSPISQVFIRPFGKPFVVVTDFRETKDIMLRKKEFDRSTIVRDAFKRLLPEHHIHMETNNTFRQHRGWVQDLMVPSFLDQIAAPQIYTAFIDLVKLWEEKSRLAEGRPFFASKDIYSAALDAVWAFMFGSNPSNSTTKAQFEFASSIERLDLSSDLDMEAHIPCVVVPEIMKAVLTLTDTLENIIRSPLPTIASWWIFRMPSIRQANKIKEEFIKSEVEKAMSRFVGKSKEEMEVGWALDNILRREMYLAEKQHRAPVLHSKAMYDEIFGMIIGAHETTATTLTWALKFLADNQEMQDKLRSEIRSKFANAAAEKRAPSVKEITKTTIPYLDAVIEEVFRYSPVIPNHLRRAIVDVKVLGHRIPKGTEFFMVAQGPGILEPPFRIDEALRNASAREAKYKIGSWRPDDMANFKPERWLVEKDGQVTFNASLGPHLAFGIGPRACFGRKMAYMIVRQVLVLIFWSLELQKCPDKLSSYAVIRKITSQPQQCYVKLRKL